jgi:hypothetical protein
MGVEGMTLKEVHSEELDRWIAERHYLKCTPAGAVLRLEFLDENQNRIGAMMWGRPPSPKSNQKLLCLSRMYFIDETEHCVESKALAMARKYIRKHKPDVKGLIAYSSTGQGHEGIIYQADNWFEVSRSKCSATSWESRPNRSNKDLSEKIKWCRTP